jgi:predicted nucleic acid-binding protein
VETVNVSGLKNNPTEALRKAQDDVVLVMNRDQPHALMVGIGRTAVIGMTKTKGLMPSARGSFETLHRSDFRISAEVIRTVLARVGEEPEACWCQFD